MAPATLMANLSCGVGDKITFNYTEIGRCHAQAPGNGRSERGEDGIASQELIRTTRHTCTPLSLRLGISGCLQTLDCGTHGRTAKYSCLQGAKLVGKRPSFPDHRCGALTPAF